jgi:hypothetical protein
MGIKVKKSLSYSACTYGDRIFRRGIDELKVTSVNW